VMTLVRFLVLAIRQQAGLSVSLICRTGPTRLRTDLPALSWKGANSLQEEEAVWQVKRVRSCQHPAIRMHIGFISPYDWSYPGGVRNHILHLAAELQHLGHTTHILTAATGPQGRLVEPGITKLGWALPLPWNGSLARIALSPLLVRQTRTVLEREQFDVVHLHEPLAPALPLATLHLLKGGPTVSVGTFHASAPKMLSMPRVAYASAQGLLRPSFNQLTGRIAVSPAAERFISHAFPGEYQLIPNGVDLHRFSKLAEPLPHLLDGKLNLLYLGRIEPRKGLKYLLQALPAIRARFPHTRLIIVGDGPQRRHYERLVQRHGWADVVFIGFASAEDVPRYYASCDLFCAPSTGSESQGVVLLEAMASGKAVIASNIDGYRDVLQDGVEGRLVPPRESSALAETICQVLADSALRGAMGVRGRERVAAFAWPQIARPILNYYQSLLECHRQRVPLSSAT
jgi:phosphatidylinositol alpha-mannosyltransferase